jgi:hypothetical protein
VSSSQRTALRLQWADSGIAPKKAGYGMPCAHCSTYYAANLTTCPICNCPDRIAIVAKEYVSSAEFVAVPVAVEEQRERRLREFKSQALPDSTELSSRVISCCKRQQHHPSTMEVATVCQACYDRIEERLDILKAVLEMDVKDAAEVIYKAAWSDPSDPSKSYENAAQAMLSELKKRSGITPL